VLRAIAPLFGTFVPFTITGLCLTDIRKINNDLSSGPRVAEASQSAVAVTWSWGSRGE
jgi:hypothetical protein